MKPVYVFDLDDCLIFSKSVTRARKSSSDPWTEFTTKQFSVVRHDIMNWELDFSDFDDAERTTTAIEQAEPNLAVIKILNGALSMKYDIGIITARANKPVLVNAITKFFERMKNEGHLKQIPGDKFKADNVFAVGDEAKGKLNPSELKANVIRNHFLKRYSVCFFFDDDQQNIDAAKRMGDDRIRAIKT